MLGELVDTYGVAFDLVVDRLSPKTQNEVIRWDMADSASPTTAAQILDRLDVHRPDKSKKTTFRVRAVATPKTAQFAEVGDLLGEADLEAAPDRTFFGSIGNALLTGAMFIGGAAAVGAAAAGTFALVQKKRGKL